MLKRRLFQLISLTAVAAVLSTGLAGCGLVTGMLEEDGAPFYQDRVSTVVIVMPNEDWEYTLENTGAEDYVQADFWFNDELVQDVAVRPKGNSSLNTVVQSGSARMSLKIDFNFFNSARTFYGLKKINLNNGYSDPTLIREMLGYAIFEEMGIPTPRATFVDVWVNDTHLGVYTMVEHVDKTFLENNFADASGDLYKPEMPAGYLNWTEADLPEGWEEMAGIGDESQVNMGGAKLDDIMEAMERAEAGEDWNQPPEPAAEAPDIPAGLPAAGVPRDGLPFRDMVTDNISRADRRAALDRQGAPGGAGMPGGINLIEQMDLKTNEENPDYDALLRMLDVLNNEPDETFVEEIEKVLDVDQVLRFLAVSAAIVHLDNYIGMGHNYYLYEVDGRFTVIPWDLNMCFGTFNSNLDYEGLVNFYIDEPTAGPVAERPLVRLLDFEPYLEKYHGYLEEIIEGPLSQAAIEARIDALADLIRPYVEEDELKFYTTEQFEAALRDAEAFSAPAGQQENRVGGMRAYPLKAFIQDRIASIAEQLAGLRQSGSGDGSGNGGTSALGVGQAAIGQPRFRR